MTEPITRRRWGLFLAAMPLAAQTATPGAAIHFEIAFAAPAARIYQVLLDAKQFSACTKLPAVMDSRPGGTFKLFDGQIEGRNIELVPDKRIVQAWRPAHWPAGEYSVANFELTAHMTGTRLIFDHKGFPAAEHDSLSDGWKAHYWQPLHKYLDA